MCAARDGDARRRSAVRRGVASVTPARRSLIVAAASDLLREVRLGAFGAVRQELEALEGKGVCSLRLSVAVYRTALLSARRERDAVRLGSVLFSVSPQ